jgi:hypothetical protein
VYSADAMLVCPSCGNSNAPASQRCVRCGALLQGAVPFESSTPATHRMGRTILGIAPAIPAGKRETITSANQADAGEATNARTDGLQPFAPAPGTLTGLSPTASGSCDMQPEPIPQTLTGLANPSPTASPSTVQTPREFGEQPGSLVATQPSAQTSHAFPPSIAGTPAAHPPSGPSAHAAQDLAATLAAASRVAPDPPETGGGSRRLGFSPALVPNLSGPTLPPRPTADTLPLVAPEAAPPPDASMARPSKPQTMQVPSPDRARFKGTLLGFSPVTSPNQNGPTPPPRATAATLPIEAATLPPGASTAKSERSEITQVPSPDRARFKGTLLGFSPVTPPNQNGPTPPPHPTADAAPLATPEEATLPPGASTAETEETEPPRGPVPERAQFKETLLGFSPVTSPNQNGPTPPAGRTSDQQPSSATAQVGTGPAEVAHHATILGMASPIRSAINNPVPPGELGSFGVQTNAPALAPIHGADSRMGTLLGVAMPGIAPMQPEQTKAAIGGPNPSSPPPQPLVASTIPRQPLQSNADRRPDGSTSVPRLTERRRLAWFFGIASAFLVILIVVALGVWWSTVHLRVEVATTESGLEQLQLDCANCPDGTRAIIDTASATFKTHKATIDLTRRLVVGLNRLTLQIVRPNRTRGDAVKVTVPVEFRVRTSVAELALDPPALSVEIETTPGTTFLVEGRAPAVGPKGVLSASIDVSGLLTGQSATVVPLERRISYEVIREGAMTKGSLVVRTGITPLEVTTPGPAHVTQNATFTLSGRTSAQAKLVANGHAIPIAADGTFRQDMQLSAPGATVLRVRAQDANQAPRLVNIAIERVTNLRQRADELARSLPADFDAISAVAANTPDSQVALHAELVAMETIGALTRIVGTSSCKQGPCLSSVRYGGTLSLVRGSRFIALGKAHLAARPNSSMRDLVVEASLVVEESVH